MDPQSTHNHSNKHPTTSKTLTQIASENNWSEIKKVRAYIAVVSVQKSAERTMIQKEKEKNDSLES